MDTQSRSADTVVGSRTMAGALRACQKAVSDVAGGKPIDGLREPLRLLCLCARRETQPPEAVVIQVKQVVDRCARAFRLTPTRTDQLRERVVTLAIDIYFADAQEP